MLHLASKIVISLQYVCAFYMKGWLSIKRSMGNSQIKKKNEEVEISLKYKNSSINKILSNIKLRGPPAHFYQPLLYYFISNCLI